MSSAIASPWFVAFALTGIVAGGCTPGSVRHLEFDPIDDCTPQFASTVSTLNIGSEIEAVLADDDNPGGAWVVGTTFGDNDSPQRYYVVHRLGGPLDDAALPADDPLPIPAIDGTRIELVQGPPGGQAWLLLQQPGRTAIYVYERNVGRVAGRDDLHPLPTPEKLGDPDQWRRHVLFIAARPFLFVAPRRHNDGITMFLIPLSPNLAVDTSYEMTFDVCDHESCPTVDFIDSNTAPIADYPGAAHSDVALHTVQRHTYVWGEGSEQETETYFVRELAAIRLRMADGQPKAAWHTAHNSYFSEDELPELPTGAPEGARDEFSTFVLEPSRTDRQLHVIDHAEGNRNSYAVSDMDSAHLLALSGFAGLLDIDEGGVDLIPLLDLPQRGGEHDGPGDDDWHDGWQDALTIPATHRVRILDDPTVRAIKPAGREQLLVHHTDGTVELGAVSCE